MVDRWRSAAVNSMPRATRVLPMAEPCRALMLYAIPAIQQAAERGRCENARRRCEFDSHAAVARARRHYAAAAFTL